MSASAAAVTTATITPELFPEQIARSRSRALVAAALALFVVAGFGLRAYQLSADGLSEDELNKVRAVEEYRERGLTPANGEHPFLMKALLTASIVAADRWNTSAFALDGPEMQVPTETAARLPGVVFGAMTAVLIFLVASELFGVEVGLIAAALWAFGPAAVGFNRIAKEDTFLLFFFLLANVFWLRGQRVAEEGVRDPRPFYWAAAAAFGAMMASKYIPYLFCISVGYYYAFQGVQATRWRMGKRRWLIFFSIMGATFLLCNPTILLPGTWHEMKIFAGERRIGHDSYEFLGNLYRNQVTLWLQGLPWHFYYVFMGVKLPLTVVASFLVGLPFLFRRRMGDGRYFILFWLFFWFFPFTVMGGKFTRYFTFVLPAMLITSAIGVHAVAQLAARSLARLRQDEASRAYARAVVAVLAVAFSAYASASAAPHYRLYTNILGGGWARAGSYFPHDEFYDAAMRETAQFVARTARAGARVASETPELLTFYAQQAGRDDLVSVSFSDREALKDFSVGDVVVVARGRRYFSNDAATAALQEGAEPAAVIKQGPVEATRVYALDAASLELLSRTFKQ